MKVKQIAVRPGDKVLIPGDLHFDQQDDAALTLVLRVAANAKINTVCLVGDTFESAGISRHSRPARKFRMGRGTIASEREAARPYLEALDDIVSLHRGERDGGLHCLTGNHEKWWEGVQDEVPGLLDTPWHEVYGDIFDGWHIYQEHTALRFGPLLVCHGHRLRGSLARHSAASVLGNYPGQNTLYGHTHRIDTCITPTYKYGRSVAHGAWTIGHLKRWETEIEDPNIGQWAERHRQGFALVYFFEVEGDLRFHVDVVPIERTESGNPYCVVKGEVYA